LKNSNNNTPARDNRKHEGSRINKFFFNNPGMKICSAVIAVIVWAVIINIDDPYKTRSFNVEVETINENALNSVNKVYEVIEGNTALVKVKGKKSVVDKLNASDVRAVADLSNLSTVNAVAVQPSLRKIVSSEVILECEQVLKVSLENKESKQVKVNVIANGTPGEGYTLGECTAKPNMIEVAGGESAVRQITSVKVFLNVNGATEDFTKKLVPVAYNEDDNKVESATLSFSNNLVRVFAQILEDKTVPVKVKVTGKPASGYVHVSTDCLPEEASIAGSSRRLSHISSVVIPVDISGMNTSSPDLEQDIYISEYLPEGITPVAGSETVSIRITLEQVIKKNIEIDIGSVGFASVKNGLEAEIVDKADKASLLVAGRASILNGITSNNINAYINCNGLDEGEYSLPLVIKDLDKECTILDSNKIKVRIFNAQGEEEEPPEETATAPPVPTKKPVDNNSTPAPVQTQEPEDMEDGEEEPEEEPTEEPEEE